MSIMILVMMLIAVGAGFMAGRLVGRRLPPASERDQDPRLAEQGERIELLEDELQRLRDQADFTEKLLAGRGDAQPEDGLEGNAPD